MRQPTIVAAGRSSFAIDKAVMKEIKGSFFVGTDRRFTIILLVNLLLVAILVYRIQTTELKPVETVVIEQIPERFAKLIVEKPIPKEDKKSNKQDTKDKTAAEKSAEETPPTETSEAKPSVSVEKKAAQKAVAQRASRVEEKMRTVGVLGMLTGTGTTAKGPAVVDVLGDISRNRQNLNDLESALDKMTGLQNATSEDVVSRKLVKSKELSVVQSEKIDALVSGIQTPQMASLEKRGDFVIQRPETIEGAGSSSEKRDNTAINKVVSSNRTSIRMSYEKFLQRSPDLAGKITVRFTIGANGRVTAVVILENTTGNTELENEIVRKIKMWRFDEIPDGDATVTYPFVFKPS